MSYQPLMRRPLSTIELTAEQEEEIRRFVKEIAAADQADADRPSSSMPTKRTSPRRAPQQSPEDDMMELE